MRLQVVTIVVVLLFSILVAGLFHLVILRGQSYKELSDKNCIRLIPQTGSRGTILDGRGQLIVGSTVSYDVVVLPQAAPQLAKTLSALARALDISENQLRDKFKSGYREPSVPVVLVKNISVEKAILLEERRFDIEGVVIQTNAVRSYPYANLAAHLIGYLGEIDRWRLTKLADYGYKTRDIVGMGGLEERYDYYLRQDDGGLSVEVDHFGRFTRVVGFKPPRSGKTLQTTIDLRVQQIVEEALGGSVGSVVVLDPSTGEVIAMASRPDFDPRWFLKRNMDAIGRAVSDPRSPFLNRATSATYAPGSVFKPVTACAGLEQSRIGFTTTFHCPGSLMVGRRQFKCWGVHNDQDLGQAITHSCDVFFYRTGLLTGPQQLHDYALKFGLGKTTGIELPYEEAGNIPDPLWRKLYRFQKWYDGETANFAIGQGEVLVTPLQICRMTAAFANGGFLVRPYIVKALDGHDVSLSHRRITALPFKRRTMEKIRQGLRGVVQDESGTAHGLAGLSVAVAGKTGTAETDSGASHAWFAGFFPYEKPRYAACVFLEHGGHGYYAADLLKRIIERMQEEGVL